MIEIDGDLYFEDEPTVKEYRKMLELIGDDEDGVNSEDMLYRALVYVSLVYGVPVGKLRYALNHNIIKYYNNTHNPLNFGDIDDPDVLFLLYLRVLLSSRQMEFNSIIKNYRPSVQLDQKDDEDVAKNKDPRVSILKQYYAYIFGGGMGSILSMGELDELKFSDFIELSSIASLGGDEPVNTGVSLGYDEEFARQYANYSINVEEFKK